ncbi:MAG: hypothetical protein UY27_C0005G0016 [Candidatus Gottesmanbacteria bacterium GW2011_GWA1_48_13]|uniref:Uncharacterized protein n=1 Tax=Candidatus Gottesmanbacteria bacterium GW2011_GWA1_48_13 TaxID=1618439 RepID=A0A0G1UPH1_9BACT|nr:MAG: hypothetical protein UY27_C0005G0016 [Candidatus Gottesmanbacteria bacterium GW2011_GWA1_48_13]
MEIFTDVKFDERQDVMVRRGSVLLSFWNWPGATGGNPQSFRRKLCDKCQLLKARGSASCTGIDDDFNGTLRLPKDKKFADLKEIVARAMCAMVKGLEEYFQDARIIDVVRGRTF